MFIKWRGTPGTTEGGPECEKTPAILIPGFDGSEDGTCITGIRRNPAPPYNWQQRTLWAGQPGYFEMQYPVLFPNGRGAWYDYNRREQQPDGRWIWVRRRYTDEQGKPLTLHEWLKRLMYQHGHMHLCSRVANKFLLDAVATYEAEKVRFDIKRRERLRIARRADIERAARRNAAAAAASEAAAAPAAPERVAARDVGRAHHNSSLTGSPAYYALQKRRALATLSRCGTPSFFITMTCNPEWPEIQEALEPGQPYNERPDIVARVFREKKAKFLADLRSGAPFGGQAMVSMLWVVEYQKRGLPHLHCAVRVSGQQPLTPATIDCHVSACLPEDPYLRAFVQTSMTHKHTARCGMTEDRPCKFRYPKDPAPVTTIDDRGYVRYKRNPDSQWVVPYNAWLLKKYHCHVNVEVAAGVSVVAYLFKYVFKGSDTAQVSIQSEGAAELAGRRGLQDAVEWLKMRYLSAPEAAWTALGYHRAEIVPTVAILPVHLPGNDNIMMREHAQDVEAVADHTAGDLLRYFHRPRSRQMRTAAPQPLDMHYVRTLRDIQHHQPSNAARDEEAAILRRYLPEAQVQAVLTNDFDRMTYTTYWEHYIHAVKSSADGWWDGDLLRGNPEGPQPRKIKRRDLTRANNTKICIMQGVSATRGQLFYLRLLLKHLPARSFRALRRRVNVVDADAAAANGAPLHPDAADAAQRDAAEPPIVAPAEDEEPGEAEAREAEGAMEALLAEAQAAESDEDDEDGGGVQAAGQLPVDAVDGEFNAPDDEAELDPDYHKSFEEAARARGYVVDDNEAELTLDDMRVAGRGGRDMINTYITLCTLLSRRDPFALLRKFGADMETPFGGNGGDERKAFYAALADGENRVPLSRETPYNRLLICLDQHFDERGLSNAQMGLPAPILPAGHAQNDLLQRYLQRFCRAGGDGYVDAKATLQSDLEKIVAVPDQCAFFWQMWARLQSCDPHPGTWRQRWNDLELRLPAACEPPADILLPPGPNVVFLDAKGGRGKTFVLKAVLAAARLMEVVSIAACFTGLAANDYPGGQTCHRAFQLPVRTDGSDEAGAALISTMHVDGDKAELLRESRLIIIDEAPMSGKKVVEAARHLLRGIDEAGGGGDRRRLVVYSGDFQQISPVVTYGDRRQQVNAWLATCEWWRYEDAPAHEAAEPADMAVDLDDLHEAPPLPKGVHRMSLSTAMRQTDAEYDAFIQRVGAAAAPVCPHLDPLERAQVRPRMLPRMYAVAFRIVSRVFMQDSTFRDFGRGRRGLALPATLFPQTAGTTPAVKWTTLQQGVRTMERLSTGRYTEDTEQDYDDDADAPPPSFDQLEHIRKPEEKAAGPPRFLSALLSVLPACGALCCMTTRLHAGRIRGAQGTQRAHHKVRAVQWRGATLRSASSACSNSARTAP